MNGRCNAHPRIDDLTAAPRRKGHYWIQVELANLRQFLDQPGDAQKQILDGVYVGRRFLIVGTGGFRSPGPGSAAGSGPAQPGRSYDFEGTAEELDSEDPRLGS